LWGVHARMDFIWMTRALGPFLWYLFSELILGVGTITGVFLLAERFGGLGQWSKSQVLFMLGYGLLVQGALGVFFNFNVTHISRRLGRGQLDHTLIAPQPIWMALITDGFAPFSGASILLAGGALFAWSCSALSLSVSAAWFALLAVNVIASVTLVMAWNYIWGSLAFWAPRGAEEINTSTLRLLDQLKPFPLDGLGASLTAGLMTVLPVGFVAWYPSRTLLGFERGTFAPWVTPLAAIVMFAVAVIVFRKGLEHYGRTGSGRYHAMGHRR
jgi:ABC-2 type transport system permease protein